MKKILIADVCQLFPWRLKREAVVAVVAFKLPPVPHHDPIHVSSWAFSICQGLGCEGTTEHLDITERVGCDICPSETLAFGFRIR